MQTPRFGRVDKDWLDPADTVEGALRKVLVTQARRLREHEHGTRRGEDPEALRKMRTAVRRLRTAVRLLGDGVSPGRRLVWVRELTWLGGCLGAVRDFDVLLGELATTARRSESRDERLAATELQTWLNAERTQRRAELLSALDSSRYRRLRLRLARARGVERRMRARPAAASFLIAAQEALTQAMARLMVRGRRLARRKSAPSDHDLHELRIRVRRLRHQLELLSGLTGNAGSQLVTRLTRLQNVLGEHQDAVVASRLMRGCLERQGKRLEPATELAVGKLHLAQERRAAAGRVALGDAWTRFASAEPRVTLEKICRRLHAQGRKAPPRSQGHEREEVTVMSCTLYLIRHAIAELQAASGRDADRRLTREGSAKMRGVARGLQRIGVEPDLVLSSPLTRAEQTAELLCRALAPELRVSIHPTLAPSGSLTALLRELPRHSGAQHLFLVGHEPNLGRLAALLLTGSPSGLRLPFKKGGVVAIELSALPPRSKGQLQWSLTPKQLRALGGARS